MERSAGCFACTSPETIHGHEDKQIAWVHKETKKRKENKKGEKKSDKYALSK